MSKISITLDDGQIHLDNPSMIYVRLADNDSLPIETKEFVEGQVFLDYDKDGNLIGIEIL